MVRKTDENRGTTAAARGHFRGYHLLPRTGAIAAIVSKPTFKTQGNVTRWDSDYPRKAEHLGLPTLGKWPQYKVYSVQICMSCKETNSKSLAFKDFLVLYREKDINQYRVTRYFFLNVFMCIINYSCVTCKS